MTNEILSGLCVLDLTTTIAGPHCTRLLADLGAEVMKIETPEGDMMRTRPPLRDGVSSYFGQLNAGKQSLVLDLKQPAAVEIVKRLVRRTDVLVENFSTRRDGAPGPRLPLQQRQRAGRGQLVDVSMLESMLTMTLAEIQRAQFPLPSPGRPMFGPLETRDGFLMPAVASERTFRDLARAAGREDWLTDPRFAVYGDRRRNWHLLIDELEQWSRRLTTEECRAIFDRFGVPCSPYRTVQEAMAGPQLAHRQAFAEVHDGGGAFRALNPPFRFSAARRAAERHSA